MATGKPLCGPGGNSNVRVLRGSTGISAAHRQEGIIPLGLGEIAPLHSCQAKPVLATEIRNTSD
jgi:hypothetical protein